MKYTTEITVNAPIDKVAELLGDHAKLKYWMKELRTYETVSGKPREVGAKTKLYLAIGPGVDATETILEVDFPRRFKARYEMGQGSLVVVSQLTEMGKGTTKYTLDHQFEFKGMLKVGAALMKPAFIKHSERMMQDFKALAEGSKPGIV